MDLVTFFKLPVPIGINSWFLHYWGYDPYLGSKWFFPEASLFSNWKSIIFYMAKIETLRGSDSLLGPENRPPTVISPNCYRFSGSF